MAQPNAFGLTSLYDPSIAVDQAALDRQMLLAQELRKQAMTPIDTAGRQVGGMAYRISPMEGLAKLLQGYSASKTDEANDKSRLVLAQKQAAALGPMFDTMFGEKAPGASPQTAQADGTQPAAPTETQGEKLKRTAKAAMLMGNTELANKLISNYMELTPEQKNMAAKGQNPQEIGAIETQKLRKEANAPTRLGANFYGDVEGKIQGLPTAIPGAVNVRNPGDPSGWQSVPVPGALPAIQSEKAASAIGGAAATPFAGVDANGQPLPVQSTAAALGYGTPSPTVSPATQGARDVDRMKILKDEFAKETDPTNRAAIQKEIDNTRGGTAYAPPARSGTYAAPPLGTEGAQKALDQSWGALSTANREAQNTKSYLQNIVTAAEKGAIVGPGADRREMIQGMLQLAGVKEEVNTNATTQTQLLNKYSNQIVARLGQGGLGTDAARAILASAYPGQHMNVDAIREAVGNLNGAQDMTQAKTRFLQDSAIKRDTSTYQQREIAFDQAADPRIWQYKAIRDPAKRKAFAQQTLQQDPTFPERIQKLESLGAL